MLFLVFCLGMVTLFYWISNNFFVWVVLELVSMLVFLVNLAFNSDNKGIFSLINYFFVQAVGGILLLGSFLLEVSLVSNWFFFSSPVLWVSIYMILFGLLLKVGVFPYYIQIVYVFEYLSGVQCYILSTYPKILPFLMLSALVWVLGEELFVVIGGFSILIGGYQGMWVSDYHQIFSWSTISHSSWMMFSFLSGLLLFVLYFVLYALTMFVLWLKIGDVFQNFYLSSISNMGVGLKKSIYLIFMVGLGGFAPMMGFILKILVVKSAMIFYSVFVVFLVLLLTVSSLVFYIRMIQFLFNINQNFMIMRSLGLNYSDISYKEVLVLFFMLLISVFMLLG